MTIDRAIDMLATREAILVFTGAGISTDSGIPDFRGPDGVWTHVDPAEFTLQRYLSSPATRSSSWQMRVDSGLLDAEPNPGHFAVVELWESGRMIGCVTQNIDGLHTAAGLPDKAIVELHGNAANTRCVQCHSIAPTTEIVARYEAGDPDPPCDQCGGILKVDVVFFGEAMPAHAMTRATAWASGCDAVIAAGSTLSVFPAAHIPLVAMEQGAPLIIINQGATELDAIASLVIDEPIGSALSAIAVALE